MRNERTGWRRFVWLIVAAGLAVWGGGGAAVRAQQTLSDPVEVYVMLAPPDGQAGLARVYFIRMVTGDVLSADVRGERFTLVGEYVLYEDPDTRALYRLWPDGRTEHHPFIQPAPETERIDWVVSPDGQWIAWMLTNRQADGQLQSVTTLARWDGTQPQIILTDGPDAFVRAVPIALTNARVFFFDRQPQGVAGFSFYPAYASIYRLNTQAGVMSPELLPFEPNCYCGAAFSPDGNTFARLEQVGSGGGYDVRVWDLAARVDRFAPTLDTTYQAAGAALVSPDGKHVIYSLANNLTIDSAGSGRERFMLAVMDVDAARQRAALVSPILAPLLPVRWTEANSGVLLVNPRQDGTWKLNVATGEIRQVAAATYIGTLNGMPAAE